MQGKAEEVSARTVAVVNESSDVPPLVAESRALSNSTSLESWHALQLWALFVRPILEVIITTPKLLQGQQTCFSNAAQSDRRKVISLPLLVFFFKLITLLPRLQNLPSTILMERL